MENIFPVSILPFRQVIVHLETKARSAARIEYEKSRGTYNSTRVDGVSPPLANLGVIGVPLPTLAG
jgi:hypothetical protein